jgi:hypothetical protein
MFTSFGEMPTGEAQDRQRRRYPLRHDVSWFRELRRGTQDLPRQVQRGEFRDILDWKCQVLQECTDIAMQNLVARGEHTRPGQTGAEGESGSAYDNSSNAVLGNPMDPSSEGATDFAGYTVAHQQEY